MKNPLIGISKGYGPWTGSQYATKGCILLGGAPSHSQTNSLTLTISAERRKREPEKRRVRVVVGRASVSEPEGRRIGR